MARQGGAACVGVPANEPESPRHNFFGPHCLKSSERQTGAWERKCALRWTRPRFALLSRGRKSRIPRRPAKRHKRPPLRSEEQRPVLESCPHSTVRLLYQNACSEDLRECGSKTAKAKKSPRNSTSPKGEFRRASACRRTRRSAGGQEADPTRCDHVGRMPSQDVWSAERWSESREIVAGAPRSVIRMAQVWVRTRRGLCRPAEEPRDPASSRLGPRRAGGMAGPFGEWNLPKCSPTP